MARGAKAICLARTNRFYAHFASTEKLISAQPAISEEACVVTRSAPTENNGARIPTALSRFLRGDGQNSLCEASEKKSRAETICWSEENVFWLGGENNCWAQARAGEQEISTPIDAPKMFPFRALALRKFRSQLPPALPQASAACGKPSARIDFSAPLLTLL